MTICSRSLSGAGVTSSLGCPDHSELALGELHALDLPSVCGIEEGLWEFGKPGLLWMEGVTYWPTTHLLRL